ASSAAVGGALEAARHEVRRCAGSQAVPGLVTGYRPDLVIMDLPVGDPDRLTNLVRLTHASYQPLLLCTLDAAAQRIPALEAGADAYVDKPCTPEELVLHVRALLRRAPWLARTVHRVGELVVDEDAHVALFDERPVTLSVKEFGLLAMLAQHAGAVLSKRVLLQHLWGYDAHDENLVEVHVSALRRRLPTEASRLIHTVRGVGYVLRDDVAQGRLA
ncbi:MAG: response regulator transcription factor, partial [Acidimicrobiales bacterium]